MEVGGIGPSLSSFARPGIDGPSESSFTFFNYLISKDRDGLELHELCLNTGNIDSCKISNPADAKEVYLNGAQFVTGKPDPNQPGYLNIIVF